MNETTTKQTIARICKSLNDAEDQEYVILVDCINCYEVEMLFAIRKGTEVREAFYITPCPYCGCCTLTKRVGD